MKNLSQKENNEKIKVDDKHSTLDIFSDSGFITQRFVMTGFDTDCSCKYHVKDKIPTNINFYIDKIAAKLGWTSESVYTYIFLNNVDSVSPAAVLSMILREIAIELDKKYEGHIEDSSEIYVISMLNGKITKANKAHIKNYRNFAAFRTVSDAKIACSIVRDMLKEMF